LRKEKRGFVRSEESLVEDGMKARPGRREIQFIGRRTHAFEITEWTITFSFQFPARAVSDDIGTFQPDQVID